ncbi:hypothetical protein PLESTF_001542800 [Pleodorina starrii]|nr:hypothetical protein PLESTF_001542800 [Pleodorina starrii]
MNLGTPSLAACLADGTAPKLPSGSSWVALSPDALTSARLAAGQIVLVGVTGRVVQPPGFGPGGPGGSSPAPAPAGRSPGPPLTGGSSSFGPAPELLAPEPGTGLPPQPLSLWRLCGGMLGLGPGLAAASGSDEASDPTGGAGGGGLPLPGAFLLPARMWPAAKLPRAAALLSPVLRETAGQPTAGTVVLLYRPSAVGPAPAPAGLETPVKAEAAAAAATPSTATAAATAPVTPAATRGAPGGANGAVGAVGANGGPNGGAVVLQLCGEALLQAPVSPAAAGGSGAGGGGGAGGEPPAASPLRTPAGKGPRAGGGGAGGRSPATPAAAAASPALPRGGGGAAAANGGEAAGYGGSGGALQQWPLDTLRRAADVGDEATRTALAAVARRHLAGRHMLAGAPLALPVLGSSVLFRVVAVAPPPPYGSGTAVAGGGAATPVEVGRGTRVVVLYPGEPLPEEFAAAGGGGGGGGGGGPGERVAAGAGGGGGSVARLVAVAREAAAAAVAESAAEAAADAAERALLAGLSSGGVDFSQLGGVGPHLGALRELVALPLRAPHLFAQYGIRPPRGVLLYGPPGSGKTVLARAAAADAGATVFLINGPDVVSEYYGESEASVRGIFAAASALAPSLVLMDEVDALAPARSGGGGSSAHTPSVGGGGSDVSSRLVTALLTLLDGAEEDGQQQSGGQQGQSGPCGGGRVHRPVVVVAATNRPDALDPALRRPGRLEREIEVGVPGAEARLEILQAWLRSVRHCLSPSQVGSLAASAHGFVSADLAALVDEAAMCALRRRVAARGAERKKEVEKEEKDKEVQQAAADGLLEAEVEVEMEVVTLEDFKTAETRVRPSALREVPIEIPAVRWDDIGGMHSVKQALQEAVEWPHKAQSAMSRLGAQPPRGVLLFGPPGCSKTLLARAVASEARLNFLAVKGGELVSKYVGESEKAIAGLFARARSTAPSIIFFDELDGLVGSRGGPEAGGGGTAGMSERLLSQLLTEMDGLLERGGVTVLAATNRPDCLDPALLRPGRFDRLIHVPLPDRDARVEILRVQLRCCPVAADVDVELLAVRTAGYSGADLAAVVREAGLAALEEDLGAEQVAMRHFETALRLVAPSVQPSTNMMAVYGRMQRAAVPLA